MEPVKTIQGRVFVITVMSIIAEVIFLVMITTVREVRKCKRNKVKVMNEKMLERIFRGGSGDKRRVQKILYV